jgi:CheY-like chemotaxis protein
MRAPSILIVHSDRKTQRTVQRILGVTGYPVDIADDLEQGIRLVAHLSPILIVLDGNTVGSPRAAAFFEAVAQRGTEACMTLLGAPPVALPAILGMGAVTCSAPRSIYCGAPHFTRPSSPGRASAPSWSAGCPRPCVPSARARGSRRWRCS